MFMREGAFVHAGGGACQSNISQAQHTTIKAKPYHPIVNHQVRCILELNIYAVNIYFALLNKIIYK